MIQVLFKKHFWALRLAGIAGLALIVAGGVNDWVGDRLFAVPEPGDLDAVEVDGGEGRRAWGRVALEENAADVLSARHVFDLNPEPAKPPPAPVVAPEPEPEADDGELDDTELAIDLVGTMVMEEAASSMATLEIEGRNRIGWTGSELLGGKAKILKIAQRHIILEEGGEHTVVRLWEEEPTVAARPKRTVAATVNPHRGNRARTANAANNERLERIRRLRSGIRRAGAYNYRVDRSVIAAELQDMPRLQREARTMPSYKDRRYQGIKLVGVRPGSLYRALGIRSGDVLTGVNGQAIDNPTRALELFEQLRSASTVEVEIERRGQKKQLRYDIK